MSETKHEHMADMDKSRSWPYYYDDSFIRLIPKGIHFSQSNDKVDDEERWEPVSVAKSREIQNSRRDFLSKCGMASSLRQENYGKLGVKTCFILKNISAINRIDTVEELLADHSTLFSRSFMLYEYSKLKYHGYMSKDERLKNRMEIAKEYRRNYYRDNNIPGPSLSSDTLESVLDQTRDKAHKSRNNLTFYLKKLNGIMEAANGTEDQIAENFLMQLKKWGIEDEIEKTQVSCLMNCIDIYCSSLMGYRAYSRNDVKFFYPINNRGEYKEFQDYQHRKETLEEMREKCVQWNAEHSFPDACSSSVQNGMVLSQKKEEELMRAVQEYTAASRGKEDLDKERIKEIAEKVLKDKNVAAIRFLIICVQRRSLLGKWARGKRQTLDLGDLNEFCKHVYRAKPDESVQRFIRLKLLVSLFKIFEYDSHQVEENLMYFLKYHGYGILSPEEAAEWETVLKEYGLLERPVSLAKRYYDSCEECIKFNPVHQYGYKRVSQLHQGGWLDFAENTQYGAYIRGEKPRMNIPEELVQSYLKEWGNPIPDVGAMVIMCYKFATQQKWNFKCVEEWAENLRKTQPLCKRDIDFDEFYTLLTEAVILNRSIKKAKLELMQAVNRVRWYER